MVLDLDPCVSGGSHVSDDCSKATASSFRAKVAQMKNWKPNNAPSDREKLELYALHKQVVSNDAPCRPQHQSSTSTTTNISHLTSPAERAKLNAWQTKRGLSQSQAMTGYILEADRQILIYGTAPTTTPRNTPKLHTNSNSNNKDEDSCYGQQSNTSIIITPRGLAAVPLLCAAASETRHAYLQRLSSTTISTAPNGPFSEGWWRKQEPLCGDPGTILALPETALIVIATALESFSLSLNEIAPKNVISPRRTRKKLHINNHNKTTVLTKDHPHDSTTTLTSAFFPPNLLPTPTIQSFLWPLHNTLLIIWMLIIFLSTATGTAIVAARTIIFGRRTTSTSLEEIFVQEIQPLKQGVAELCAIHQSIGVRLLGLALYPIGLVCELTGGCKERCGNGNGARDGFGAYLALGVYTSVTTVMWWYWLVVLPWVATGGILVSVGLGCCFALIELSGNTIGLVS